MRSYTITYREKVNGAFIVTHDLHHWRHLSNAVAQAKEYMEATDKHGPVAWARITNDDTGVVAKVLEWGGTKGDVKVKVRGWLPAYDY
jgi:hypothetical protein